MNIKRAKEEIEHTVKAYLAKDALGEYAIPAIRQRPILLMGPPGIGKTQVMEQVARECGVALVAYTITHHTRQSAVGLPFIRQRNYGGKDVSVTEYTMSEIIASIYAKMEATGLSEGILFIDEINCVSETLAPTMLQFLQCKTFGNQAVPAGWVIVAAGNPPEYNKSVRDFDIVTLDRVRRMDIEPDLPVWKDYARAAHIHSAILSYLELHPQNFYQINADVAEVNRQLDTENAEWAAIGADIARKQKELEEQRKQNNVQLPPTGDGWLWPLPASNLKLTSAFGYRMHPVDHVPNSHTGIDVAASTGVPIYAARGGQVIMSEYGAGANWSYGNFVVIDHGDGTTTLYAHMSSRAVSEGQMVSQGQTIGAVGDTGNTSGPHLHYEVRRNGQRTDPEAYYPNLPFIRAYNW